MYPVPGMYRSPEYFYRPSESPWPEWMSASSTSDPDLMAKAVLRQFVQNSNRLKPEFRNFKVISGFVVVKNGDLSTTRVLSWATGTKCLNGGQLSTSGLAVIDCHAEILARRGLLRVFYGEIAKIVSGGESDLLEKSANQRGFVLKDGLSLHLYISTAPCGAARCHFFEPLGDDCDWRLRMKAEATAGTVAVEELEGGVLTVDGVLGGMQRLMNMSCTDKLTKWRSLGLQGSLLSKWMEPLFLKSLIVGSFFHRGWLNQCINDRVITLGQESTSSASSAASASVFGAQLKMEWTQHYPPRDPSTETPDYAVNWNFFDDDVEILNARIGKLWHTNGPSKLCKKAFLSAFTTLNITEPEVTAPNERTSSEPESSSSQLYPCTITSSPALQNSEFGIPYQPIASSPSPEMVLYCIPNNGITAPLPPPPASTNATELLSLPYRQLKGEMSRSALIGQFRGCLEEKGFGVWVGKPRDMGRFKIKPGEEIHRDKLLDAAKLKSIFESKGHINDREANPPTPHARDQKLTPSPVSSEQFPGSYGAPSQQQQQFPGSFGSPSEQQQQQFPGSYGAPSQLPPEDSSAAPSLMTNLYESLATAAERQTDNAEAAKEATSNRDSAFFDDLGGGYSLGDDREEADADDRNDITYKASAANTDSIRGFDLEIRSVESVLVEAAEICDGDLIDFEEDLTTDCDAVADEKMVEVVEERSEAEVEAMPEGASPNDGMAMSGDLLCNGIVEVDPMLPEGQSKFESAHPALIDINGSEMAMPEEVPSNSGMAAQLEVTASESPQATPSASPIDDSGMKEIIKSDSALTGPNTGPAKMLMDKDFLSTLGIDHEVQSQMSQPIANTNAEQQQTPDFDTTSQLADDGDMPNFEWDLLSLLDNDGAQPEGGKTKTKKMKKKKSNVDAKSVNPTHSQFFDFGDCYEMGGGYSLTDM